MSEKYIDEMVLEPRSYQRKDFLETYQKEYYGILYEQGMGKTKVIIDTACALFLEGKIDGVLVIAPNGVHANWAIDQLGKHLWASLVDRVVFHLWNGTLTKTAKKHLKEMVEHRGDRMAWMFMNIESIRQGFVGHGHAIRFLTRNRCLMVIDESTIIKNLTAKQTKSCMILSEHAPYRRILTGTPITQGAIDIFPQARFLSPHALPYKSFTAFRNEFAIEVLQSFGNRKPFKQIVGYRNLDKLRGLISNFAIRRIKADHLELPEKIYMRRPVPLTREQQRAYKEMQDLAYIKLMQEQSEQGCVSAPNVLSLILKLQEILCGFIIDDKGVTYDIAEKRTEQLGYTIDDSDGGKVIIWCRFRYDIHRVMEFLTKRYGPDCAVSYYGEDSNEDRSESIRAFQSTERDSPRFFVATRAASRGITLTSASTAIYYSQGYSLEDRLQSEDRNHRIGQRSTCVYIDFYTPGAVDDKIITTLRDKGNLAAQIVNMDWKAFFVGNPQRLSSP
jgi:hypothetical protein